MRVASLLLVILLAGCSANTNVRFGSGATTVPPGTAVTSSSVDANVQSRSVAGVLISIGILAAAWHGSERYAYGVRDRPDPFAPGSRAALESPLDESRRVNEQDCTRPIEDWSANLKCK